MDKADRNTHISGWSLLVCPAGWTACLHMICRAPLCALREWNVSVMSGQDIFKIHGQVSAKAQRLGYVTKKRKNVPQ